jgi:hypothetical protein
MCSRSQEDPVDTWVWILIIVVAVVVVLLIVAALGRRRRTAALQQHFGPEYDRTVQNRDGRRAAEANLRSREKQRARLELTPIPEATRARFAEEWRVVQEQFVDQPTHAVTNADNLLHRVMAARGYPMEDFESQADLVSVDHPHVVQNYRSARGVYERAQSQRASTEDLRQALVSYRSLFDELLQADSGDRVDRGAVDDGRGGMDDGRGAVDNGRGAVDNGRGAVDNGRGDVDNGVPRHSAGDDGNQTYRDHPIGGGTR